MKVLVVGSSGFLGGWVKKLLIEDNEHEIIEIYGKKDLDITNAKKKINFKPKFSLEDGVKDYLEFIKS